MDKWGYFSAVGSRGSRFGLIGHDSGDVSKWLAAHPDFDGNIYFDYGNDEPQIDVTEVFFPEVDEDVWEMVTRPAATVAGSVNLLDATRSAEVA